MDYLPPVSIWSRFRGLTMKLPMRVKRLALDFQADIGEDLDHEFMKAFNAQDWQRMAYVLQSNNFTHASAVVQQAILNEVLEQSCRHGQLETARLVLTSASLPRHAQLDRDLRACHDPFQQRHSPLGLACLYGHLAIVKYLLTSTELRHIHGKNADLHQENDLALRLACGANHLDVVRYLLTSPDLVRSGHTHADIHADNDAALMFACMQGNLEVVRYLLTSPEIQEHADIHAGKQRALRLAMQEEHRAVVNFLIFEYHIGELAENWHGQYPELENLFHLRTLQHELLLSLPLNDNCEKNRLKL